jgi:hypothetical protein
MTYPNFPRWQKRTFAARLIGLAALISLAGCHTEKANGTDAASAAAGQDALPSANGNDVSSSTPGGDAPPTATSTDVSSARADASSVLTADNFPTTFANDVCGSIGSCCLQAGLDSSSCKPTLQALLTTWVTKHGSDPKIVFDPDAAARCIQLTRAGFLACTDRSLAKQSDSACNQMFHGTVPLGGGCTNSGQCIPPSGGTATCDSATCTVGPPPSTIDTRHRTAGEPCNGTCRPSNCSWSGGGVGQLCWTDDGLYCSDYLGVCVDAPEIGESCDLYCNKGAHCTAGVCAPNLATGTCEYNDDCITGAYCDRPDTSGSGQCALLREIGAACSNAKQCASGQCLGGSCRPWSMASDAVCSGVVF